MTAPTPIPVSEARQQLGELLNRVRFGGESFVLTVKGKPAAMLAPIEDEPKRKKVDLLETARRIHGGTLPPRDAEARAYTDLLTGKGYEEDNHPTGDDPVIRRVNIPGDPDHGRIGLFLAYDPGHNLTRVRFQDGKQRVLPDERLEDPELNRPGRED